MKRKSRKQCINCEYFRVDCETVKEWIEKMKTREMKKTRFLFLTQETYEDCPDFKRKSKSEKVVVTKRNRIF